MIRQFTNNVKISIHAPTRGATKPDCKLVATVLFQSTLPRGERPVHALQALSSSLFQSTLPRGERRISLVHKGKVARFQSTLPRGERRFRSAISCCAVISIHAPTRGATNGISFCNQSILFQSTLPRGERRSTTLIF